MASAHCTAGTRVATVALGAAVLGAILVHATSPVQASLVLGVPDGTEAQDPEAVLAACVTDEYERRGMIGGSIAVMVDGEIVLAQGFGRKHSSYSTPVNAGTQFRIGSTTKQFTAAGVMRLVDQGMVDLDAPVTTYLPELAFAEDGAAERVTVRDLLRHTSGVPDTSAMVRDDMFGPNTPEALAEWVAAQRTTKPWAPPGRFYNYSSANYMYLGRMIEKVTGRSFQDYMATEVLAPAGLGDSTFLASEVVARDNYAFGHWWDVFDPGTYLIVRPTEMDSWARHATGYLHSTTSDLVAWAKVLMDGGGDVVTTESASLMQSAEVDCHESAGRSYGFGVFSDTYKSLETQHHAGGAWAWSATLVWVPEREFAVATLSNTSSAFYDSTDCAIDAYLRPEDVPVPSCPRDPAAWPSYVGEYAGLDHRGRAWRFDVTLETGVLTATVTSPAARFDSPMTQTCADARTRGPATFLIDTDNNGSGDQAFTFIHDPEVPGVIWMRNRFIVARGESPTVPPSPTTTASAVPSTTPGSTPSPTPRPPAQACLPIAVRGLGGPR